MLLYTPPFQTAYQFLLNDPIVIERLKLKYGHYLLTTDSAASEACTIDCAAFTNPSSEIDRYVFDHTAYDESVLALHGGAVEWRGEAYLFLAATTSGKTTLTSYLTSCGCGYITDDCILIDRSDFCVHPFTTPIQLRDGGLEVLKRYQAVPECLALLEEGDTLRRWVYTPENRVKEELPLKRIFFIERTEHENAVINMTTTERMTALMKSPITNYTITGDYLRLLSCLAKVECHVLRYCDMRYVKELIQNG